MTTDPFNDPRTWAPRSTPADVERDGWTVTASHRILDLVEEVSANDARSFQAHVGPSEIGSPCTRRLALRTLNAPRNRRMSAWATRIGVAVHAWLAEEAPAVAGSGFLTEVPLHVEGEGNRKLAGTADVVWVGKDTDGAGVVDIYDYKVVGPTTMREIHAGTVPTSYKVQGHTYALGAWRTLGLPPREVGIVFLPSYSTWDAARVVYSPFDLSLAEAGVARWRAVQARALQLGVDGVSRRAGTADDYCMNCPFRGVSRLDGPGVLCRGHSTETKAKAKGEPPSIAIDALARAELARAARELDPPDGWGSDDS